jgi:protein phosphatase 1L
MKIVYGVGEALGYREQMEDASAIWDMDEEGLFAAEVYDGHSGRAAALAAAEMMTPRLRSLMKSAKEKKEGRPSCCELVRETYLSTDAYIVGRGLEDGAAAATLYIKGEKFVVANSGDTRVIIGKGDDWLQLTLDHKPDVPEERQRIERLGGSVIVWGVPRVQGILAMSRALGDPSLKPFVTAEPRITEGLLGKENDLAVIACDGVWDVLKPREVIVLARQQADPQKAAEAIVAKALDAGSTDNITVVVLYLSDYTATLSREHMEILSVLDKA